VGEAPNGEVSISKYVECQPDVVTMDITMPDMSGIEALKKIRELDPEARVVMVSAMGQESMVKEAIISGAKSFIVKPFKEDHIVQMLKKIAG
jgi:two-component system chemotaxis response regulator CheY